MNTFASLAPLASFALLAALSLPFNSQAQTQPQPQKQPPPRAQGNSDYNQRKKAVVEQQERIASLMENFKRCYTSPPQDAASKTKCDAIGREFMKHVDEQIFVSRTQIRCANASTTSESMQACLRKEIQSRMGTAAAPGRPAAPAQQGTQPVRR